jgi:hypothetical protein
VAEAMVLVCDECGKPDAITITIRADGRNYVKDLCGTHLRSLLANTRAPRRGRKRSVTGRATTPAPRRTTKSTTRKKRTTKPRQARKKTAA